MLARWIGLVVAAWLSVLGVSSHAAALPYIQFLNFEKGWNLVGNSAAAPLDVKARFGAEVADITSIWKWNASTSRWAFYAPSLDTAGTLTSYCAGKGYDVLTSVELGEGFWVNYAGATGGSATIWNPNELTLSVGSALYISAANFGAATDQVTVSFTGGVSAVETLGDGLFSIIIPSGAQSGSFTVTNNTTGAHLTSSTGLTLTATVINVAPVANAGTAQNVKTGTLVTLNGSASSDANNDALTYAWTLTSKPAGSSAALSAGTSVKPTFTADVAGTYVASLTVNDGKVNSTAATVSVTAAVANVAPVANAGVAQNVVVGSVVTLDGSASSDANSDPLTYAWTLTSKPAGSTAALSSSTSAKPTFTADVAGSYVGTLTVNDGKVNSTATTVTTTATATMKAIAFDSLTGGWDGIANAKSFTSDDLNLSVSISGTILTIRAEQFFDGTCEYAATLNANHDAVTAGTYQCSDFTSGSWSLLDMQRVDQNDIYIRLKKDGVTDKRFYGLAQVGVNSAKVIPAPISTLAGTYDAVSTGGPFGTQPASNSQIAVNGTTLTITLARFFTGTCQYTATIQADGLSISAPTYKCADFSTGTWSLNDMRAIGGNDFYLSISRNGVLERAYGIR